MNQSQQLQAVARIVFGVHDLDPLPEGWKRDLSELVYGPNKGMLRMMQRVAAGTETLPPDFMADLEKRLIEDGESMINAAQEINYLANPVSPEQAKVLADLMTSPNALLSDLVFTANEDDIKQMQTKMPKCLGKNFDQLAPLTRRGFCCLAILFADSRHCHIENRFPRRLQ